MILITPNNLNFKDLVNDLLYYYGGGGGGGGGAWGGEVKSILWPIIDRIILTFGLM